VTFFGQILYLFIILDIVRLSVFQVFTALVELVFELVNFTILVLDFDFKNHVFLVEVVIFVFPFLTFIFPVLAFTLDAI
jgi:hypothetical protein